ncbi:YcaO-like family protein [Myxococcus landrumensis]|uniref:YcaO-like family protein n=1 Tax=Myxococcus landrumensis TaxID=2813577 RepID=A0ABX7N4P0_9BACT|nr:YcaO-like family protein [Myxococcus landrumus]QSQ13423.1 YcaO-like family protein [Myxococcus landrumus]
MLKKSPGPSLPPGWEGLTNPAEPRADLPSLMPRLMDARTGVVRGVDLVQKDADEPALPIVLTARIANHRFVGKDAQVDLVCSGKGMTLEEARISAVGEAVERYGGGCAPSLPMVRSARHALDGASLDPRHMVLYRPEQYAALPYTPYDGTNVLRWVRARSLVTGDAIHVPTGAVFLHDPQTREERLAPITSNGLAAGPTLAEAVLRAACEVVERDAVMIAWLHRLPCQRIDPLSHPDTALVNWVRLYARRGVTLHLFRVPTDQAAHVFLAVGTQRPGGPGPAAVVGMGADLSAARAARGALLEVGQIRPALARRMRRAETLARLEELKERPESVAKLEDHDLLYALPERLTALAFLLERPMEPFTWLQPEATSAVDQLRALADRLKATGSDLLYCDLTPSDLMRMGLRVVRAILPGLQPIDFGHQERRLGGERLYQLPVTLGFAKTCSGPEALNPDPHPIA